MATFVPCSAKARTMPRPILEPPPVTIAVLPSSPKKSNWNFSPPVLSLMSRAPALDFQTGKTSLPANSNQATLYHTGNTTYRCFLPDLTGFIASSCIEPDYQRRSAKTNLAGCQPQAGIQPRYSGFRVQGTAGSPPSTAQFMMLATSANRVNIEMSAVPRVRCYVTISSGFDG
jgi:hypothetical protein